MKVLRIKSQLKVRMRDKVNDDDKGKIQKIRDKVRITTESAIRHCKVRDEGRQVVRSFGLTLPEIQEWFC